jgi:hypothetical protein
MVKALSSFQMEIIIKGISKMDFLRAKVILYGKMDQHLLAFSKKEKKMVKVFS